MGILGGSYLRVADTTEKHEEQYSRIVRDAQRFFYGVSKPNVSEGPADGYRDRGTTKLEPSINNEVGMTV